MVWRHTEARCIFSFFGIWTCDMKVLFVVWWLGIQCNGLNDIANVLRECFPWPRLRYQTSTSDDPTQSEWIIASPNFTLELTLLSQSMSITKWLLLWVPCERWYMKINRASGSQVPQKFSIVQSQSSRAYQFDQHTREGNTITSNSLGRWTGRPNPT